MLLYCLTNRLREQARSHNGFVPSTKFSPTKDPCGSEPAREEASPANTKTQAQKSPARLNT